MIQRGTVLPLAQRQAIHVEERLGHVEELGDQLLDASRVATPFARSQAPLLAHRVEEAVGEVEAAVLQRAVVAGEGLQAQEEGADGGGGRVVRAVMERRRAA